MGTAGCERSPIGVMLVLPWFPWRFGVHSTYLSATLVSWILVSKVEGPIALTVSVAFRNALVCEPDGLPKTLLLAFARFPGSCSRGSWCLEAPGFPAGSLPFKDRRRAAVGSPSVRV